MLFYMESNTHNNILEFVSSRKGKIIFARDLMELGNSDTILQALSRLVKEGELLRLSKGIYLSPKRDKKLGVLYPSIEEIATAIAKRDKARIMPAGAFALHKLGLSTQVPMKVTYLTDGSPRKIQIGNQALVFKNTTPKKLAMKGAISTLVIQALTELGESAITKEVLNHIEPLLMKENAETIRHDARLAPAWVRKLLVSIIGI